MKSKIDAVRLGKPATDVEIDDEIDKDEDDDKEPGNSEKKDPDSKEDLPF